MKHVVISAYGKKKKYPFICEGSSLAKQSFRDECNINNIMAKYQRTGAIEHMNNHGQNYGYASSLDFRESMEILRTGQAMFDDLPAEIRNRFGQDPAEFLDFVQNPANIDEMREMGLVETSPSPAEPKEPVAPKEPLAPLDPPPPEVKKTAESTVST